MVAVEQQQVEYQGEVVTSKYKIKLTRNTKGYNWEISSHSDDMIEVTKDVATIDRWLREKFGSE